MQEFFVGTKVYVQTDPNLNRWMSGIVVSKFNLPRYRVQLQNGAILTRNRRFLKYRTTRFDDMQPEDMYQQEAETMITTPKKRVTFRPTFC